MDAAEEIRTEVLVHASSKKTKRKEEAYLNKNTLPPAAKEKETPSQLTEGRPGLNSWPPGGLRRNHQPGDKRASPQHQWNVCTPTPPPPRGRGGGKEPFQTRLAENSEMHSLRFLTGSGIKERPMSLSLTAWSPG